MAKKAGNSTVSIDPGIDQKILKTPCGTFLQSSTVGTALGVLVPTYTSGVFTHVVLNIRTLDDLPMIASGLRKISLKRCENRIQNYVIPSELERVLARLQDTDSASIRFGRSKEGRGYHGSRGDFCLTSGAIEGKHLTLFYRSLELIGGFGYDLAIVHYLSTWFGIKWKTLTIHAARAHVFALKGNSNEKFYPKLMKVVSNESSS